MKLVLSVISQNGAAVEDVTVGEQSLTIGRAQDNALVLEDPKRYISSHHAVIDYRAPDYYLTDTSTNGVIVNNAVQPLGKGNSIRLNDGDQLHIGDYTLTVTVLESQPKSTVDVSTGPLLDEQFSFEDDPFADFGKDSVQEMIEDNQLIPENWKGGEEDSEPIFDFPASGDSASKAEEPSNPELQQPAAYKEAFEPFHGGSEKKEAEPADIFAEDWFMDKKEKKEEEQDPFAGEWLADNKEQKTGDQEVRAEEAAEFPAKESEQTVEPQIREEAIEEVETTPSGHRIPTPTGATSEPKNVTPDTAMAEVVAQFLRGAGLEGAALHQSITPETFYIIGKILRASVQGTLDVLIGRAKIKNEMHLDVTMIRSRQNNPIKFSVSAEEAIKKLLAPEDAGYLSAEDAIEEAFDDIKAHQYSVIAGMQTALLEVLKRFDPQKLEHRLQEESPISASIPIHKQAKLWRQFEHLYTDIEREASDNFYHLFGQAFAETYQQQVNQLKSAKKDTPF